MNESQAFKKNIQVAEAIDAHLKFRYTRAIKRNIAYWHYRIAVNMSEAGTDDGILAHLRSSLVNCPSHEQISKKAILAMFIKHSLPTLHAWLKQARTVLRSIRS